MDKISAEQTLSYEDRVVAYLDVLGFGALVNKTAEPNNCEAMSLLNKAVNLLHGAMPSLDSSVSKEVPKEAIPRHVVFSDTIIISAPKEFKIDRSVFYGMNSIAMRCIQLCHLFLKNGLLLRGAITVGKLHHNEIIVGPALVEAVAEEKSANFPCVVITSKAQDIYKAGTQGFGNRLSVEFRGRENILSSLHDYYIKGSSYEVRYEEYLKIAEEEMCQQLCPKAKDKWEWIKSFIEYNYLRQR